MLNPNILSGLAQLAEGCDRVMSVCTGAALLAAAGLLEGRWGGREGWRIDVEKLEGSLGALLDKNGNRAWDVVRGGPLRMAVAAVPSSRRATTNKIAWAFPTSLGRPGTIEWVRQARWVHDGKFSTAAGA